MALLRLAEPAADEIGGALATVNVMSACMELDLHSIHRTYVIHRLYAVSNHYNIGLVKPE